MRVVLSEDLPDDPGAFLVRRSRCQIQLAHAEKHPAVDGLQAVPDIGKSATHDHRHGVVDVGGLHLLLDIDRNDAAFVRFHTRVALVQAQGTHHGAAG